jgi:hypothetical protein
MIRNIRIFTCSPALAVNVQFVILRKLVRYFLLIIQAYVRHAGSTPIVGLVDLENFTIVNLIIVGDETVWRIVHSADLIN